MLTVTPAPTIAESLQSLRETLTRIESLVPTLGSVKIAVLEHELAHLDSACRLFENCSQLPSE